MSKVLSQYPDQQPSSLGWLGSFPSHWKVEPGLAVLQERQVKNLGLVENTVLSLSYGRVIVKPEEKLRGLVPESFETYQIVEPGNIIIRPTDLQNDQVSLRVGQVKDRGIITSAYLCLETKNGLSNDYAHLLLHAYDLKKVFYGLGSGLRQNLSWLDFRRLPIPAPPLDEQAQIVRFVRHLDQRVNRLINAKRRLIELLNEQKQAIIHRAVTQGLDPAVPLKPSGIDWLGDIPKHWSVSRVGRLGKVGNGSTPSRSRMDFWVEGTYPWLNSGTVNKPEIFDANQFVTDTALAECHLPRVAPGSILVGITGQGRTRGMASILQIEATINQHIAFITPKSNSPISHVFLHRVLCAAYSELRRISDGAGSTKGALTCAELKDFPLALPPLAEQVYIMKELEESVRALDSASAKAAAEIDLIREYRTRLVADVVTGQLDVLHLDLAEVEDSIVGLSDSMEGDDADDLGELEEETNET